MALTVKDLKELIKDLPDDMPVVMSKDGEGNGFSPLSDYSMGKYAPDSTWSGEWYQDEDERDAPRGSKKAICLWPVN